MKSIERRFKSFQERYPNLSSFINFGRAIQGQNFTKGMIGRWFNKLVDKNDYSNSDKRILIEHLLFISCPEDDRKMG